MIHWRPVYDFANLPPHIHPIVFLLVLPVLMFGAYYKQKRATTDHPISWWQIRQWPRWLWTGLGLAVGGEAISLLLFSMVLSNYHYTKAVYDQRKYLLIEGLVRNFDPMPKSGHKQERFTVNGVPFAFSDTDESTYGYHQAASQGGAIRPGLRIRIGYFNNQGQNVILRLDTLATKPLGAIHP